MKRQFKTRDSALSYFVNQLDNLDRNFYEPLVEVSWSRDIKLRPGISMSDESTSYILSTFGASGTLSANLSAGGNMPWISPETTTIPGVSVDGQRSVLPLRLLAREVSYTSVELERSAKTGQSIDTLKVDGLNLSYQMNTDQMVYVGSSDVGATGLINSAAVTASTVALGAAGSTLWSQKTPDEILFDVNALLTATWTSAAFAVCPRKLLLPPVQFSYITSQKVSSAGNVSILKFLKENSIALAINGAELEIAPVKWLTGAGSGGLNRMVAYTNDVKRVRFPMVPIRRETAYYMGIRFTAPYLWAFGVMEIVYPETIQYADGI